MKKRKRGVITMTDGGIVSLPGHVRMSVGEIADLFGIYYREAKRHIRTIEKSGVTDGDYTMSCTADGRKVYPEYYGLEMVIAVAFHIQTEKTKMLRLWVLEQSLCPGLIDLYIPISKQHHQWN